MSISDIVSFGKEPMNHRLLRQDGVTLQVIQTDKFKTFSLALRFSSAFLPETINARAILPDVLMGGTKKSPSREALQMRMDALYGLSVACGTDKVGRQSVVWFEMKSVNENYLPKGASTVSAAMDLLHEILFDPKLISGHFRKKTVEEEKRMLKEDFEAEYIDKTEFGFIRFANIMFQNELSRYRAKGIYETIDDLSVENVTEAYTSMLNTDQVTFIATGDFSLERIQELVFSRFRFPSPLAPESWLDRETKTIDQPTFFHEYADINQARLNIGYRLNVHFGDDSYYTAVLLNAILGEFDHSKLFQIVREKHTLCYYINSLYDSNKGVITIMAGIDPQNEEKALRLITEVIQSIQNGAISPEELQLAKESLSKRIRQNADSPERLSNLFFLYQKNLSLPYQPELSLRTIQNVTGADIQRISQKLTLDTTYLLTKKEVI
jgi:predicted Zn-dependent peptidase